MPKTIKELFEVYKPKSPDEQKFVDKHVTIKHKDRNGNDDDVFNATNVKAIKRKEERHGYDSGEDEKVYEEVGKVHSIYADKRPRGTGYLYIVSHDGQITSSGNYRHNKKFKTPEKAGEYLEKQGFTKQIREEAELEISDEELVFELEEEVEPLEEGTVSYKHYTITSHPKMAGVGEGGDIKHVYGHPKKMGKLGIEHDDSTDYGTTRRVTVKNNETGETTHHHVYQSERSNSTGKPTLSIRTVGKARAQQDKHANVIAHYLSGKTKIKEDTDLAFFEDLLEMNLDEDTFTDASLAQLRVMKHKQEMKKIESSSKLHPLMKVRKLSDAKKKLAELEAARDHYVAKHEKAQAKKKVAEEVEELDELSKSTIKSYASKALSTPYEYDDSGNIRYTSKTLKRQRGANKALDKLTGKSKVGVQEEVEELDEISLEKGQQYWNKASGNKDEKVAGRRRRGMENAYRKASGKAKVDFTEEVEDLDEGLMHDRYLRSHGKKARGTGSWAFTTKRYGSPKENEMHFTSGQKSLSDAHKEAAAKLGTKHLYVMEEVEDLDESAKIADHLIKRYGDNVRKSHVRTAIKKLAKEDIINRAIENYMPEEYVAPSLDEQFIAKIDHLSEAHAVTLLALFDSLNEENKKTMLETVDTREGINSLLDFAIKNRGE